MAKIISTIGIKPIFGRYEDPTANRQCVLGDMMCILFVAISAAIAIYIVFVERDRLGAMIFGMISTVIMIVTMLVWIWPADKIQAMADSKGGKAAEAYGIRALKRGIFAVSIGLAMVFLTFAVTVGIV